MTAKMLRLFVLLLLWPVLILAQPDAAAGRQNFQQGVKLYQSGKYSEAEVFFNKQIQLAPQNPQLTAQVLMLIKSRYKLGDYKRAGDGCTWFIERYPNSQYIDDVYYVRGHTAYRNGQLSQAVSSWLMAAQSAAGPNSRQLYDKSMSLAGQSLQHRISAVELKQMISPANSPLEAYLYAYYLAVKLEKQGMNAQAREYYRSAQTLNPDGPYQQFIAEKLAGSSIDAVQPAKIALLLPLSGEQAEIGNAIADGVRLAFKEESSRIKIELTLFDYQSDLFMAIQIMKKLSADPSVAAVFGAVENEVAAACAVVAGYENLPLITPTATSDDLTLLSENVIQLSTPVKVLAQYLATYANEAFQSRRIATLAPVEPYFTRYVREFVEAHQKLGGEVPVQQWYYPGEKNFSTQFMRLKRDGLKISFRDSVLAGEPELKDQEIDRRYLLHQRNEVDKALHSKTKIDSADVPLKAFDAVFLPVYKQDVEVMAAQFAYHNLQTHLLGNSDWYDLNALRKNKNYINGLVFVTDVYLNEESRDYIEFRNKFRTAYQKTPGQYELVGYDAFRFVLRAFSAQSSVNRVNVSSSLTAAPEFRGIGKDFNIGEKRFNNSARLLKYQNGVLIPMN